jgi:hypothetical protein
MIHIKDGRWDLSPEQRRIALSIHLRTDSEVTFDEGSNRL